MRKRRKRPRLHVLLWFLCGNNNSGYSLGSCFCAQHRFRDKEYNIYVNWWRWGRRSRHKHDFLFQYILNEHHFDWFNFIHSQFDLVRIDEIENVLIRDINLDFCYFGNMQYYCIDLVDSPIDGQSRRTWRCNGIRYIDIFHLCLSNWPPDICHNWSNMLNSVLELL